VLLILRNFKNREFVIEGELSYKNVTTDINGSLNLYPGLARSQVNLVLNNEKLLILNNFSSETDEMDYKGDQLPLSLAILPILNKGEIVGLLYLENHIMQDAYTPARLRLLTLLSSQMAISLQNAQLFEQMKHKIWLESELAAAKAVQETLLPSTSQNQYFDIASFYLAADSTGGDWYWHHFDPKLSQLYVMIGDVTGHGIPSALVTGSASGAIQACLELLLIQNPCDPSQTLRTMAETINAVIYNTGRKANRVMTMAFICLDLKNMEAHYLNAGHNSILHVSDRHSKVVLEPGSLLGVGDDCEFGYRKFTLQRSDCVFLYTDGLLENGGEQRNQKLSTRQLCKIIEQSESARDAIENLQHSIGQIWKDIKPVDDTSFLMIKVLDEIPSEMSPSQAV
jgi:serine phosphatase RsbU (regulator of sigma subunit)